MFSNSWSDTIPLWGVFLFTVSAVLISIEGGYRLALIRKKRSQGEIEGPIGSVIGGTLGLLGFLLAFTFGLAASRLDTRRELLLQEVNAIGTTYLRADLVPESHRLEIKKRLREYVHLRAEFSMRPQAYAQFLARCETLQDELWAQAVRIAKQDRNSEMYALFVASLNDMIDCHTRRVVVSQYQIPGIIWLSLYMISCLSMGGVGYQFGIAGMRDILSSFILPLSFTIVICLIADLDRVNQGALKVSQQPMIDLDQKLEAGTL